MLERIMRLSMKVGKLRLQMFLLHELRRPSLCLDFMQLTISQVALVIGEADLSATASSLENTWHADSEKSTAEGNLRVFPNLHTRKPVVE